MILEVSLRAVGRRKDNRNYPLILLFYFLINNILEINDCLWGVLQLAEAADELLGEMQEIAFFLVGLF